MDLELQLSGYFFKIHTAEAPTRAGELACEARLRGNQYGSPMRVQNCAATERATL